MSEDNEKKTDTELSLEDLENVAGGVAQVGLNVVGSFKAAGPTGIAGHETVNGATAKQPSNT